MRLVIAGSRTVSPTIEDIDREVTGLLRDLWAAGDAPISFRDHIEEVVCGGADGVDLAGKRWAQHHGIPVWDEPITNEDRTRWGARRAPKVRNGRMAERGTHALVLWDGQSGGSTDMHARMGVRSKFSKIVPWRAKS
jgi:hypothetical protein